MRKNTKCKHFSRISYKPKKKQIYNIRTMYIPYNINNSIIIYNNVFSITTHITRIRRSKGFNYHKNNKYTYMYRTKHWI